jgi:hypothetical protein
VEINTPAMPMSLRRAQWPLRSARTPEACPALFECPDHLGRNGNALDVAVDISGHAGGLEEQHRGKNGSLCCVQTLDELLEAAEVKNGIGDHKLHAEVDFSFQMFKLDVEEPARRSGVEG